MATTSTPADLAGLLAALGGPPEPAGVCQRPDADKCLRRWPRHRHVWCWPRLARADWAEARAAWEDGLPLARLALADLLEEEGWPAEGWEALALAILLAGGSRPCAVDACGARVSAFPSWHRQGHTPLCVQPAAEWSGHYWQVAAPQGWVAWDGVGVTWLGTPPSAVRATVEAAAVAALRAG